MVPEVESEPYGVYPREVLSSLRGVSELATQPRAARPKTVRPSQVFRADPNTRPSSLTGQDGVRVNLPTSARLPREDEEGETIVVVPDVEQGAHSGVFWLDELSSAIEQTDGSQAQVHEALEHLPQVKTANGQPVSKAPAASLPSRWTVMVDCPQAIAAATHSDLFSSDLPQHDGQVTGVLASGRYADIHKSIPDQLSAKASIQRLTDQTGRVLAGQTLFTVLLGGVGWLTGGIDLLVREHPLLFGVAIGVLGLSFALATWAYVAGASGKGNLDNLDDVIRIFNHRILLMRWFVVAATLLYAVALILATAVPIATAGQRTIFASPATVTYDPTTGKLSVSATVDRLPHAKMATLVVRGFPSDTARGDILVRQVAGPDSSGKASFNDAIVVPPGLYGWITIATGERSMGPCLVNGPGTGCVTIVLPRGAGTPVFALKLAGAELSGTITFVGLPSNSVIETVVTGLTKKNLLPNESRQPGTVLFRSSDGPDQSGKLVITIDTMVQPGRFRYVLVGSQIEPVETFCAHNSASSGCFEAAAPESS